MSKSVTFFQLNKNWAIALSTWGTDGEPRDLRPCLPKY